MSSPARFAFLGLCACIACDEGVRFPDSHSPGSLGEIAHGDAGKEVDGEPVKEVGDPGKDTDPDAAKEVDAGPHDTTDRDAPRPVDAVLSEIPGVSGVGGPFAGPDGCLYWTEDAHGPGSTTLVGGGTIRSSDGDVISVPAGQPVTVTPVALCATPVEETRRLPPATTKDRLLPTTIPEPGCTPDTPRPAIGSGELDPCPEGGPSDVPAHAPTSREPADPFARRAPPMPAEGAPCLPGDGWSFEDGTYAPWRPSGLAAANSPVFGNNAHLSRLSPPGYSATREADIATHVGGDYWEFSRGVNQQGNWWVGTSDLRMSHRERPGKRIAELATGTVTSPVFQLATRYLTFVIGGVSDVSQRVELQVRATSLDDAADIAGIEEGINTIELTTGYTMMPSSDPDDPLWVIARSAAPLVDGDWMGRRVVWDVEPFRGRLARFRIVDDTHYPIYETACDSEPDHCTTVPMTAHVNADDFRCLADAPKGTDFMLDAFGNPSSVGNIVTPQPIWGATESHGHATANLSFGGHFIWGDVSDSLETVYDCSRDLPAITDRQGNVLRPELTDTRTETSCYTRVDIVALVEGIGLAACAIAGGAVALIPVIGWALGSGVFGLCAVVTTEISAALLLLPVVTGRYMHGAEMPTGTGLKAGDWLRDVANVLMPGIGERLNIHGMIEERDWDMADGSHSGHGVGQLHQHFQHQMIRRAFLGGLRLMVIDVHNGRALQSVIDGRDDYDDWRAIADHVTALQRLVAPDGDARFFPGPLRDIAAIAYSPAQARRIIGSGKLAIVIGTEVGELGKARFPGDSSARQVADLYALGVRKVTPIHATDNPLGGTALFQDVYDTANFYHNVTLDENGASDGAWTDLLGPFDIAVPSTVPFPLGGISVGQWSGGFRLSAFSCGVGASCPWNLENGGYLRTEESRLTPARDWIGERDAITFLFGITSMHQLDQIPARPQFLMTQRLDSLAWLLGGDVGGLGVTNRCILEGMALPLADEPAETVIQQYQHAASGTATAEHNSGRHMNAVGLRAEGRVYLGELMADGMVIDTDHFSQATRIDAFELTREFATASGLAPSLYPEYPVFGVHTELRGYESDGLVPNSIQYKNHLGYESEISRTRSEIERMAAAGGVITAAVPGVMHPYEVPAFENLVPGVRLDCEYSSKSYATKYLLDVLFTGGHGVASGFDMNGFAPHIAPRYGRGRSCFIGDSVERMNGTADDHGNLHLASWPRDWTGEYDDDCRYNSSLPAGQWNPHCPSTQQVQGQLREFSGVLYDDYAGARTTQSLPWLPPGEPADGRRMVLARGADQWRDDAAARPPLDEWVAVGGGGEMAQGAPLVKWRNDASFDRSIAPDAESAQRMNTGWDYNLDGLRHVGLLPDLIQDMRNVGVTWEQLGPMFDAAEDYIAMWERACTLAQAWRLLHGLAPDAVCAE